MVDAEHHRGVRIVQGNLYG